MSKELCHEIDWVIKLKNDDTTALEWFFETYKSKLYLFCFRFLKSKDLTDEVVQDTFIKLWNVRHSLSEEQSTKAFIFKICRNLVIDSLRRSAREDKYKAEIALRMSHYHNHAEETIIYGEILEKVKGVVNELPRQRQLIFRLSREQGLSHEEISQKLGISKNTVKVSIFKSIKHIRHQLSMPVEFALLPGLFSLFF